jgi:exopolysaccharide biosynthesis polyprenyl glycosylphosphotransferase
MSRKTLFFWLIIIPDIVLLYASLYLAILLRYGEMLNSRALNAHLRAFSVLFVFWLVVFFIHGLFEIQTLRRYTTLVFNLISATVVNLLVAITYFYFQPNLILTPRRFLLMQIGIAFLFLLAWHLLIKYILKNRLVENLYLFSFNNELAELEKTIKGHEYLGFKMLGHLNSQTLEVAQFDKNVSIVLPDNLRANPEVLQKFYTLRTKGVGFYNHQDFYENLLRRVYLTQLSEMWFLENVNYREKRFYNMVKRTVDILLGIVGFAAFVISFPFCAVLVKFTSEGPVFFVQERVGKGGKIFKVYKYRTMSGGPINTWTSVNDPRITKVGKFLRKSRIDEWPQFINLLLGHISLVGPRPEQPHIVEELKKQIPFYDERHLVKPGLTGWSQLNLYAGSLEESKLKLQYDLYYIKNRSFFFDLEIILKTIYYIFTWQGR